MTDTKESNYQDRADTLAENAKLRAEVDFANERMHAAQNEVAKLRADVAETIRLWECVWTGAQPTTAAECMRLAENSAAILRGKLGDAWGEAHKLRAEVADLRKQAEAAAAPSDAEIDEAIRDFEMSVIRGEYRDVPRSRLRTMLRAHRPAPVAGGALREAVRHYRDWMVESLAALEREPEKNRDDSFRMGAFRSCISMLDASVDHHLAAEPEAQPHGVAVPSGVLATAKRVHDSSYEQETDAESAMADFILSLPAGAAPQPEARADGECEVAGGAERVCERGTQDCITLHTPLPGSGAELQRLLEAMREEINLDASISDSGNLDSKDLTETVQAIANVVEALARKAGAR